MKKRALSDTFFKRFKEGDLTGLVECLQAFPHFMLNLRSASATIYYKGMRVLEIREDGRFCMTKEYVNWIEAEINPVFGDYIKNSDDKKICDMDIKDAATFDWFGFLTMMMRGIDEWRAQKKENPEKEIQQRIVLENNLFGGAASTDYFIVDTEYAETGARFDAIALHWSRDMRNRHDYKPGIAFIEVKAGEKAIDGSAGVAKHLQDIAKYEITEGFYKDIEEMVVQLRDLGLMDMPGQKRLEIDATKTPQMIFAIANYNQKSSKLKSALESVRAPENIDLRFATASFLGYGLYDEGLLTLTEFIDRLNKREKDGIQKS